MPLLAQARTSPATAAVSLSAEDLAQAKLAAAGYSDGDWLGFHVGPPVWSSIPGGARPSTKHSLVIGQVQELPDGSYKLFHPRYRHDPNNRLELPPKLIASFRPIFQALGSPLPPEGGMPRIGPLTPQAVGGSLVHIRQGPGGSRLLELHVGDVMTQYPLIRAARIPNGAPPAPGVIPGTQPWEASVRSEGTHHYLWYGPKGMPLYRYELPGQTEAFRSIVGPDRKRERHLVPIKEFSLKEDTYTVDLPKGAQETRREFTLVYRKSADNPKTETMVGHFVVGPNGSFTRLVIEGNRLENKVVPVNAHQEKVPGLSLVSAKFPAPQPPTQLTHNNAAVRWIDFQRRLGGEILGATNNAGYSFKDLNLGTKAGGFAGIIRLTGAASGSTITGFNPNVPHAAHNADIAKLLGRFNLGLGVPVRDFYQAFRPSHVSAGGRRQYFFATESPANQGAVFTVNQDQFDANHLARRAYEAAAVAGARNPGSNNVLVTGRWLDVQIPNANGVGETGYRVMVYNNGRVLWQRGNNSPVYAFDPALALERQRSGTEATLGAACPFNTNNEGTEWRTPMRYANGAWHPVAPGGGKPAIPPGWRVCPNPEPSGNGAAVPGAYAADQVFSVIRLGLDEKAPGLGLTAPANAETLGISLDHAPNVTAKYTVRARQENQGKGPVAAGDCEEYTIEWLRGDRTVAVTERMLVDTSSEGGRKALRVHFRGKSRSIAEAQQAFPLPPANTQSSIVAYQTLPRLDGSVTREAGAATSAQDRIRITAEENFGRYLTALTTHLNDPGRAKDRGTIHIRNPGIPVTAENLPMSSTPVLNAFIVPPDPAVASRGIWISGDNRASARHAKGLVGYRAAPLLDVVPQSLGNLISGGGGEVALGRPERPILVGKNGPGEVELLVVPTTLGYQLGSAGRDATRFRDATPAANHIKATTEGTAFLDISGLPSNSWLRKVFTHYATAGNFAGTTPIVVAEPAVDGRPGVLMRMTVDGKVEARLIAPGGGEVAADDWRTVFSVQNFFAWQRFQTNAGLMVGLREYESAKYPSLNVDVYGKVDPASFFSVRKGGQAYSKQHPGPPPPPQHSR